ncbi:MAG: hypothetical protein JOZ27_03475 [Caulobacteraceae bacterium]|nr:hypothetical protein [Caulobacteraceae bacterium]
MAEETATNPVEEATDHAAASRPEVETHPAHTPDPAPAEEIETEGAEAETGQTATEGGEHTEAEDVEIEHEGQKYRVPAALRESFLRQADYTRKTQAVAEAARQVQAAQAEFETERKATLEAMDAEIADRAKVQSLRETMKAWERVDWDRLENQDKENGTNETVSAMRKFSQLKDALAQAEASLTEKQAARVAKEQEAAKRQAEADEAEDRKQLAEGARYLVSKIPDWATAGPQVAKFGQERFGFTPQEIAAVRDPRMLEVLHLAMIGSRSLDTKTAAARTAAAAQVRPAPTVGGRATPTKDMGRMSTDEWMRARQKQVVERRTASRK